MNILLVEDDAGIGRFVSRGLAAKGYAVAWEREGRRVAALLRDGDYRAMILDLGLPDCDGLDLCRQLRDVGIRLPIVMLTARDALQDRLDGFDHGADDYLAKPFAFEELLARLSAIIRRGPDLLPKPVSFGALELDLTARRARVRSEDLSLSPREFDLLLILARAKGQIVGRDRLLADVWGETADISDNALDVYVGYLRRHLARVPHAPRIETQRRRGFRLVDPT